MTKTKKVLLSMFSTALLVAPSIALAQWNVGNLGSFQLPQGSIIQIIERFLLWLLAILGFLGIIGFVVSGIMYLLSAGSDEAIKRAKKAMTASIIGVIVGLAGVVIVQAIDRALNAAGNI